MLATLVALFLAGMLTILLPCILPVLPVVLGVSVADRNKWRPLAIVAGMVVSFVTLTFLLQVVLSQFVTLANVLRIGTFQVLFLFGIAFLVPSRQVRLWAALLSGVFFLEDGWLAVGLAALFGVVAMELGSRAAGRIQQLGANVQQEARETFGAGSFLSIFVIGLTLGLVWVPCAGPALGLALALVRERPGAEALLLLFTYALGTAVPLLIVGYGGQRALHSVRSLTRYTGRIKQAAGILLILTAISLHLGWLERAQTWIVQNTSYGSLGDALENRLFPKDSSPSLMGTDGTLPKIIRAPEFAGLGPWHNSQPLTMEGLKGKVVLVDFWTYSCINCIRTMPYLRGYWDKYKDKPFVLLGVHTPEFTFEKDEGNVAAAIKRHELTYPIAQDNDYGTWQAFANRYWPAKYLIDANGYVRYIHFGEGGYEETDEAIASLLEEAGVDVSDMPVTEDPTAKRRDQSAETYLGARSWPALGNAAGFPSAEPVVYTAPETMKLHTYYLDGEWQLIDNEHQLLLSDTGEIRMKFLGSEANLVLGIDEGSAKGEVIIDGKPAESFTINRHDLFPLFTGDYGEHELVLKLAGKGVRAFAFTFGSK